MRTCAGREPSSQSPDSGGHLSELTNLLIDTHCHLGAHQFDDDHAEVLGRAADSGVNHVVVISDSEPATNTAIALARQFGLSASAGVHPHEASTWNDDVARAIDRALEDPVVVAVGETGLDYHYDHSPRDMQRAAFSAQLELGIRHGYPVVVHSRSADADMAAMLRDTDATYILHSFNGGADILQIALDDRAYVSFSGMVTFKSWKDEDAVRAIPADRLLIETDSPYLAPTPHRGQRNEPAFVREVAEKVAMLRGEDPAQVAQQTTQNAVECFGSRITETTLT